MAELGVYKGKFAVEINKLFPYKKLYLFDTFEGFFSQDIDIEKVMNIQVLKKVIFQILV